MVNRIGKRNTFSDEVVDGVAHKVVEQMQSMRKVVVANFMDSEAQLHFAFKGDDWDMDDERSLRPQQRAFAPYFMAGVLSVTHNDTTVSADISDTTKEYVFTVQPDGQMCIDVINAETKAA